MAWTLVQHPVSAPAGTPGTVTLTPTTNNLLVVGMFIGITSATASQPTGMAGATWGTFISNHSTNASVGQTFAAFGAVATTSSSTTISVAWTGGGNADMFVAEFSNAAGTTITQDGTTQTQDNGTGVNPIVLPTYTPSVTGSLAINMVGSQGNITGVGGSYTQGDVGLTNTADGWGYTTGALSVLTPSDSQGSASIYCSQVFGIKVQASSSSSVQVFVPHRMPLGA